MAEVVADIKAVPKVFTKTPLLAIMVGLAFLVIVLVVEAFKPGLLTGPIRHALQAIGLASA